MDMPSEPTFYVSRPPDISFVEGLFHVRYWIGSIGSVEFVMLPDKFTTAMLLAREAFAQWKFGALDVDNVVPIRRRN